MRMAISRHIRKRRGDLRLQRVAHIDNESASRSMIVREQETLGRHRVFSVMHLHALLIRGYAGQEMTVGRGIGIRVDDSEEVVALMSNISSPGKQVVSLECRRVLRNSRAAQRTKN